MKRLLEFLFHKERFYKISELRIGGHCGCCGMWVKNEILPRDWAITICKECLKG